MLDLSYQDEIRGEMVEITDHLKSEIGARFQQLISVNDKFLSAKK